MGRLRSLVVLLAAWARSGAALRATVTMMGRKGAALSKSSKKAQRVLSAVAGISAPANGKLKGWELSVGEGGNKARLRLAAARVDDKLYVLESSCKVCYFELEKGTLLDEKTAVACPLCGQSYKLANGALGKVYDRNKVANFLGKLARQAPTSNKPVPARTVSAEVRPDGQIYLDLEALAKLAPKD